MASAAQSEGWVERLGNRLISTPFAGALIALLSWPTVSPVPRPGIDPSWVAGLYMALNRGLHFGSQIVFTYGPLGFLQQPVLYDRGLWIVAFLYGVIVYVALAVALLWVARRSMPLPIAAAAVYALLAIGYLEAAAVLLVLVICLSSLSGRPAPGGPLVLSVGGGALSAVELLGKLNFGIAILAMCLLALLGLSDRRRQLGLFAAAAGILLVLLWLLTGQTLSNVSGFLANGWEVLSGYSSAMATNVSDVSWQRPWAIGVIALLLAAAGVAGRRDPPPRRSAAVAIVAVFGFAMFKQSFVRQGLGNASDFYPLMLGVGLALAWRLPVRLPGLPPYAPAAALLVPLATLSVAALPSPSFWDSLKPSDHVEYLHRDIEALLSGGRRRALQREGRRLMASNYRIDPASLALLNGRRVDVEPWEIGAAWAYGLEWQPLPVIQGYQAYTSELDRLNAAALAGSGRPTAILRQNTDAFPGFAASVDDRYLPWDPPATARAMLCHYRPVRTTRRWQVLYPTADRCGTRRIVARVRVHTDAQLRVPAPPPGGVIYADVHGIGVEGFERLRAFLYRARERWVAVNGRQHWRLVPGTAGDGLLLRAAAGVDFPGAFALAPEAHALSFHLNGSARKIDVVFYAQQVRHLPYARG
jgi:hypothetical protein